MGRTAGQPARVAAADCPTVAPRARASLEATAPSAPTPPRAPISGVAPRVNAPRPAAECHTVREVLPPWHVLEDELKKRSNAVETASLVPADQTAQEALAVQEAANAQWMPTRDSQPPSSGVKLSEPELVEVDGDAEPEALAVADSLLTFKVYTLAELERRDGPASMRMSQASFDTTASRGGGARWQRAFTALRAFGIAALAWWKTPGPRPNPKIALRQPFDDLGDGLQVAIESVDWKKHGVTTGIVVGATLTLLFAVLTAAELTDDLKPGASAHLASSESSVQQPKSAPGARGVAPATNMAAMGVQPVSPLANAVFPAQAAAVTPEQPATSLGEIDDPEPEAAPTQPKRAPSAAPVAARKPKPKTNKLTFRNADAIFNF